MAKKRITDLTQENFLSNSDIILAGQDNKTIATSMKAISEFVKSYITGGVSISGATIRKNSDIITVSDTTGLTLGIKIVGPHIPSGAVISQIIDSNSFKISVVATDNELDGTIITIGNLTAGGTGSTFSGVSDGTIGIKGLFYKDAKPFDGVGDGKIGEVGVLYVDGSPYTGISDGTVGINNLLYKKGQLFDGIGDGVFGVLNVIYEDGKYFTGVGNGTIGEKDKIYYKGSLFTGSGTADLGKLGILYKYGVLFNGIGDGKLGIVNIPYINGVSTVLTNNGVLFSGTGNGTVGKANILYKDGNIFNGTGNGTVGINGKIYSNGVLFSGIGNGTVGLLGKLYYDGVLFSGMNFGVGSISTDALTDPGLLLTNPLASLSPNPKTEHIYGIFGRLYSQGILYTGFGDGMILGTLDSVYVEGLTFTGVGDGTIGLNDKIYYNGKLLNGISNGKVGVLGYIYSNGVLFTGSGNGIIGALGTNYVDGHPVIKVDVNDYTGIGDGTNGAIGVLYKDGVPFSGLGNGTVGFNNIVYKDGKVYSGFGYVGLGNSGQLYKDGILFSGVSGTPQIVYLNGVEFTGVSNGTVGSLNKLYKNGVLYTGKGNGTNLGVLNYLYLNGVLFDGVGNGTLGENGKIYDNGIIFNGIGYDNIGATGYLYDEGILANRIINSILYKNGLKFSGFDNGKLYSNGSLYTGVGTGNIGVLGVVYTAGVSVSTTTVKSNTYSGNSRNYVVITTDNDIYEWGQIFSSISKTVHTPSRLILPNNITERVKDITPWFEIPNAITTNIYSKFLTSRVLTESGDVYHMVREVQFENTPIKYLIKYTTTATKITNLPKIISLDTNGIGYNNSIALGDDRCVYRLIDSSDYKVLVSKIPNLPNIVDAKIHQGLGTFAGISEQGFNEIIVLTESKEVKNVKYNQKTNDVTVIDVTLPPINKIACGDFCSAIASNGNVYFWGKNVQNAIPFKNLLDQVIPNNSPLEVQELRGITNDIIINSNSCAVLTNTNKLSVFGTWVSSSFRNTMNSLPPVSSIFSSYYSIAALGQNGVLSTFNADIQGSINYLPNISTPKPPSQKTNISDKVADGVMGEYTNITASFNSPKGIAINNKTNDIYVVDELNNKIRKISPNGNVTTFAGSSANHSGYVNGNGINARFNNPISITIGPDDNLYVSEIGRIRKITLNGDVSTYPSEDFSFIQKGGTNFIINGLAFDSNFNLYAAVFNYNKIVKITPSGLVSTLAGGLSYGSTPGDYDATGIDARFEKLNGIAIGPSGNIYVSHNTYISGTIYRSSIRKITPSGVVTTFVGGLSSGVEDNTGRFASFNLIQGITVDSNENIYALDNSCKIRKITPNGVVTTIAGGGSTKTQIGSVDGNGINGLFNNPTRITLDSSSNLYITDSGNIPKIRKYTQSTGNVSTIAGTGIVGYADSVQILDNFIIDISKPLNITKNWNEHDLYFSCGYKNDKIKKIILNKNSANDIPIGEVVNVIKNTSVYEVDKSIGYYINSLTVLPNFDILGGLSISSFTIPNNSGIATFNATLQLGIAMFTSSEIYTTNSNANQIFKGNNIYSIAGNVFPFAGETQGFSDNDGIYNNTNSMTVGWNGDIFVCDTKNNRIRRVTQLGEVSLFVGGGTTKNASGDILGTGTNALFKNPTGIIFLNEYLYVTDSGNNKIKRITSNGVVTLFAGSTKGFKDSNNGSLVKFSNPTGITYSSIPNNTQYIYISDTNNSRIRRIHPTGSSTINIQTVISTQLFGCCIDANNNIYVSDTFNNKIRKITPQGIVSTFVGGGTTKNASGDLNESGTNALFKQPRGLTIDSNGNIYVCDSGNHKIKKITSGGVVTTYAGIGTIGYTDGAKEISKFNYPCGIFLTSGGDLYISDTFNHIIRKITSVGVVSTIAGLANTSDSYDGTGEGARFTEPNSIVVDTNGNIFVSEPLTGKIRKISSSNVVTTVVEIPNKKTYSLYLDSSNNLYFSADYVIYKRDGQGIISRICGGTTPPQKSYFIDRQATFIYPNAITRDSSGNLYVCDSSTIRKITPAGVVSTIAGAAGQIGSADGTGAAARFCEPSGITIDSSGNLYVCDIVNHNIRKITPAGVVSTIAGMANQKGFINETGTNARFNEPIAITIDPSGNLYVCDRINFTIRKITSSGVVTNINNKHGYLTAITIDPSGNLYVCDIGGTIIRKITPAGVMTTVAGNGQNGSIDLQGSSARFQTARGITIDPSGNLYVCDNKAVRKITPSGDVSTFVGSSFNNVVDGIGKAAGFGSTNAITIDPSGNLYVADGMNRTIRKVTPSSVVTTIAGSSNIGGSIDSGVIEIPESPYWDVIGDVAPSYREGATSLFGQILGMALDSTGNIYVVDGDNSKIRKISQIS